LSLEVDVVYSIAKDFVAEKIGSVSILSVIHIDPHSQDGLVSGGREVALELGEVALLLLGTLEVTVEGPTHAIATGVRLGVGILPSHVDGAIGSDDDARRKTDRGFSGDKSLRPSGAGGVLDFVEGTVSKSNVELAIGITRKLAKTTIVTICCGEIMTLHLDFGDEECGGDFLGEDAVAGELLL
jgi:hypothetical protein